MTSLVGKDCSFRTPAGDERGEIVGVACDAHGQWQVLVLTSGGRLLETPATQCKLDIKPR